MSVTLTLEQKNYNASVVREAVTGGKTECSTEYCQGNTLEMAFGKVEKIIKEQVEDPLSPTDEELRLIKTKYQSEVLGRICEVYLWG